MKIILFYKPLFLSKDYRQWQGCELLVGDIDVHDVEQLNSFKSWKA